MLEKDFETVSQIYILTRLMCLYVQLCHQKRGQYNVPVLSISHCVTSPMQGPQFCSNVIAQRSKLFHKIQTRSMSYSKMMVCLSIKIAFSKTSCTFNQKVNLFYSKHCKYNACSCAKSRKKKYTEPINLEIFVTARYNLTIVFQY